MVESLVILAVLGLCLGSFLNAVVWRIHQKMDWVKGRSECDRCQHQLATSDLVPVLSWLALHGRCRYCHKSISWQHPAVELVTALCFVASYIFWPGGLHSTPQDILFITWLVSLVGLLALLVYDFRWMILPSKILYPTLLVASLGRLIYLIGYQSDKPLALADWLLAMVVCSGIFWAIYNLSKGTWIGFGDVRLGFVSAALLATPDKGLLMIFLASILGCLFTLPMMAIGRKQLTSRIPFGPFLIAATGIVVLFGSSILNWYLNTWS